MRRIMQLKYEAFKKRISCTICGDADKRNCNYARCDKCNGYVCTEGYVYCRLCDEVICNNCGFYYNEFIDRYACLDCVRNLELV